MEPSVPATQACAGCGAPFAATVAGQTLCDRCQGLAAPEPPKSPLQQVDVGAYKIRHEIGAGRFSTSWLAEDPQHRAVVVKILRRYAPDTATAQRFMAEAQRIAHAPELAHPHLARLVDGGLHLASAFFLVYEAGGESTLADELRSRGRVVAARALDTCAQLAEGLATLHRAGIAHLDLKPANVGLTKDGAGGERAMLLDFATAHLLAHAGLAETEPLPLSTAGYAAPEEAKDARSDVYSLGALLFQLVSGRLPVMGATAAELQEAHRTHTALRLRDAGRRVHDDLEALVARLLPKDPAQRPHIDEVPVLMRSIAAVADTAPMDDGTEGVEDPVPVVLAPRPEPELVPPPPRPVVDPALERAMLGHVPPQPPERAPGIPKWAPRVWPRWASWAALGVVVLGLAVTGAIALSGRSKRAVVERRKTSAPKAPIAVKEKPAAPPPPVETARAPEPAPAPVQPAPTPTPPAPPKKSPYAKEFERAQKALWTGQAVAAETILQDLLHKPRLSTTDRTRVQKLMGDAEAKRGNKASAVVWYRRALRGAEDDAEREKLERALAAMR